MSSVRLFDHQVWRMRAKSCPMSLVLDSAVRRYRAGEIVTRSSKKSTNRKNALRLVSWRNRPADLSDADIRAILDAHFAHPVDYSAEIKKLDHEIEAGFKSAQETT